MGGKQVETYESMITPRNVSAYRVINALFIDGEGRRGR
jgi:hypothetical protein